MARAISILGTGSDVGKSVIVAGLCRLFANQNLKVAPFKGQNMALNSYVTLDGAEIGRAQALQAFSANVEPTACMNPILLKPTSMGKSQVMVKGQNIGEFAATDYYASKASLLNKVDDSLEELMETFDIVILEGAGSPAEINLPEPDLVNLGLCERHKVNAILVGDIERGGVIASIVGTVQVVKESQKKYLKGFMINKFSGDLSLFDGGLKIIEDLTGLYSLGILGKFNLIPIELEDSYSLNNLVLKNENNLQKIYSHLEPCFSTKSSVLNVGVVKFPHLSNVSDFDPLRLDLNVNLNLSSELSDLTDSDLLILPGTKSTVADMEWFRKRGGDSFLHALTLKNKLILGICGGYQMLGKYIIDDVESQSGKIESFGYLDVYTEFEKTKLLARHEGKVFLDGRLITVSCYQIQNGRVVSNEPWISIGTNFELTEGAAGANGLIYGTSLHGIFENDDFRYAFLRKVAKNVNKEVVFEPYSYWQAKDNFVNAVAKLISDSVNIRKILDLSLIGQ